VPVKLNAGAGERGFIQMQLERSGRPVAFDVRILAGDHSTLAHETAHFLSWSLHDLATSDLASPDLVRDYGTLIKWAGYGSPEERLADTKERQELGKLEQRTPAQEARLKTLTAKEEKISHGWEQYLLEGKSPNAELRPVFTRFKDWLVRIYRGIAGIEATYRETYGQELQLSDDVRKVFDRLLAADDALQDAQRETGAAAVPPPLLTAAMTPEERESYRRALVAARLSAEATMDQARGALETKTMNDARAKMMADAARELDQQPLYRAMRYLQRGELVDAKGDLTELPAALKDENGNPYKLNRPDLVEQLGADVVRRMPPGVFAPTKKGGVPAEQLAPLLGFDSAEDMAAAFTRAEPRQKALERLTQDKMDEAFGPTTSKMAEAAMNAVHNIDRARATLLEIRAMAKSVDPKAAARVRSMDLGALKAAATRLINESPLADVDPAHFARIERQTAEAAARSWGAGDKEQALEQQEARLFNQLLYRAARDAVAELEKAKEKLENTSDDTRGALGKADPSLRDVHDSIIAAVGLGASPKEPKTLDELLAFVKGNELEPNFDMDVPAIRKVLEGKFDWDNLTVDEARAVSDAVKNLRHLAHQVNEVELAGQKQTRDAWFKDLEEHTAKQKPLAPVPLDKAAQGLGDRLKHLGRGADALLTDVAESYAHSLDAGDRNGPAHRLLVDGRLECRDAEVKLNGDVLKPILEHWQDVPKDIRKLRDRVVDVAQLLPVPPGGERQFSPVYTRSTLWMLFLNWGNEGNRQRIRDGMGWTDDNVQQALSMLSKPELKFLQGVLNTINSLWPDVARTHEKRTGLKLDKVESSPITLNGEEYAGGYFPLKADRRFGSRAAQLQEGAEIKSIFGPNYERAFTPASHRKERADRAVYPVDLSWGVVPAHLSQVIHDVTYGDWVRQTASILRDPRFVAAVNPHLGAERSKEFMPWLADVANAKADSGAGAQNELLQQLGAFARNRAAVAVMGMNLPAILPQVLDPWNAFQENVPARHIAAAYVKVNSHIAGLLELPELQLSKELKYRDDALKNNLREQLGKLGPTGHGLGKVVSEVAFALYEVSDKYTSRVTWKAAFDHAQSDGLPAEEAAARADDVVRRAYASHDVAEKPPLMRSKRGFAAAVMFYGFANRLYNSLRRTVTDTRLAFGDDAEPGDRVRAVARVASKLMMLGLTGAAFSYLAGRGPKKDEDAKKWLAWRVAMEPMNTVPFLGPAVEKLVAGQHVNVRNAPELDLMATTLTAIGKAAMEARNAKDRNDVIDAVEALIGPTLSLTGLPAGQLGRTGGYLFKRAAGESRPRRGAAGVADTASGLYYGERKNQSRNPLTDVGDLLQ
jgi:hypothetical protein